jgi:glycosyltransferase involved in cell wall biosynthesis
VIVIYYLFILAAVIQLGYALFFIKYIQRIPFYKTGLPQAERKPISIIICAKNEAANLKKNLPAILQQRYNNEAGIPLYEVIVVNDASDDDTEYVLKYLELRYNHLRDVAIPPRVDRDLKGKKFALSKGLAYATHDWIVLTDADCMPPGDQWLEQMAVPLAAGKEIVAGYGAYRETGSLLNIFIRWETMHAFLQYSTYALAGMPYMAVGRNMACTRRALEFAQSDKRWNSVASGDDDMLVNIAGDSTNTVIIANPEGFTFTDAKTTLHDWLHQKQRHLSTGKYYNDQVKWLLGLYGCAHALLWVSFFVLLCWHHQWSVVIFIMAMRCAIYWVLWATAANKLHEKKLFLLPVCDIGWMVYNFVLFPYITWKNKSNWK